MKVGTDDEIDEKDAYVYSDHLLVASKDQVSIM